MARIFKTADYQDRFNTTYGHFLTPGGHFSWGMKGSGDQVLTEKEDAKIRPLDPADRIKALKKYRQQLANLAKSKKA